MKSKVPLITLAFWIVKFAAITLGETGGDAFSMTLNLGYAVSTGVFFVLLASKPLGTVLGDCLAGDTRLRRRRSRL